MPTTKDAATRNLEMGSGVGLVVGFGVGILLDAILGLPGLGLVFGPGIGLSLDAGVGLVSGSTPKPRAGTEIKPE